MNDHVFWISFFTAIVNGEDVVLYPLGRQETFFGLI